MKKMLGKGSGRDVNASEDERHGEKCWAGGGVDDGIALAGPIAGCVDICDPRGWVGEFGVHFSVYVAEFVPAVAG